MEAVTKTQGRNKSLGTEGITDLLQATETESIKILIRIW